MRLCLCNSLKGLQDGFSKSNQMQIKDVQHPFLPFSKLLCYGGTAYSNLPCFLVIHPSEDEMLSWGNDSKRFQEKTLVTVNTMSPPSALNKPFHCFCAAKSRCDWSQHFPHTGFCHLLSKAKQFVLWSHFTEPEFLGSFRSRWHSMEIGQIYPR